MAALLQTIGASASNVTSFNTSIGNSAGNGTVDTTAGSLLVAYVASNTAGRTCSASDSVNGAYNTDIGSGISCSICTFPNAAGGPFTLTASISGGLTGIAMIFEEWSGIVAITPKDQSQQGSGTASTSVSVGPTSSLAQANELVLTMCAATSAPGATFVVQSPYTASTAGPVSIAGTRVLATGWNIVSSTSGVSSTFNFTNSINSRISIATYKLAALGAQQPPLYSRKYILFNT